MPCMKITRGRRVGEPVTRAHRVARSNLFCLSSKKGTKKRKEVPDGENPGEVEDAVPDPPVPPSPPGSPATQQDCELKALAESIKRMYAGYVDDFVKEVYTYVVVYSTDERVFFISSCVFFRFRVSWVFVSLALYARSRRRRRKPLYKDHPHQRIDVHACWFLRRDPLALTSSRTSMVCIK